MPFTLIPQAISTHAFTQEQFGANILGNRDRVDEEGTYDDKVEELGLREDTLIVFAADNGFSCGHHGFWGKGNGTFPRNMYENSVKVPFVASHPGRRRPARRCRVPWPRPVAGGEPRARTGRRVFGTGRPGLTVRRLS